MSCLVRKVHLQYVSCSTIDDICSTDINEMPTVRGEYVDAIIAVCVAKIFNFRMCSPLTQCQNMEVDRQCSSSSADSIAGDSNDEDVGYSKVIRAEGVSSFWFLRERWESKGDSILGTSAQNKVLKGWIWSFGKCMGHPWSHFISVLGSL